MLRLVSFRFNVPMMSDSSPLAATQPAHVVLYQPEIPQNTGNIGRTCVAVGAKLWIVEPASFQFDEKRVRRAGLDYWQYLDWEPVPSWEVLCQRLDPERFFFFSKFARRTIWEADFQLGDVLVFGRETSGLPASILKPDDPRSLRLPMREQVRSLNLSVTAGIALYEHQRQTTNG
nr:tRNA (cytidine(34)-2'-O)-methyltransferase [Rhodopirellula sp. JC737]